MESVVRKVDSPSSSERDRTLISDEPPAKIRKVGQEIKGETNLVIKAQSDGSRSVSSGKKHKKEKKKSKHKDKKHKHKHKHKDKSKDRKESIEDQSVEIVCSEDSVHSHEDTSDTLLQERSPSRQKDPPDKSENVDSCPSNDSVDFGVVDNGSPKNDDFSKVLVADTRIKNEDSEQMTNMKESVCSSPGCEQKSVLDIDLKDIELPPTNIAKAEVDDSVEMNETVKSITRGTEGHEHSQKSPESTVATTISSKESVNIIDLASIPEPETPHPASEIDTLKIPLPETKRSQKKSRKSSKVDTGISQSSLQATLRESMLREVQRDNSDMPQSIVDDMFKDFLATKMQQIEEEYKKMSEKFAASKSTGNEADIASSVDEMNRLLDAELDSISQNTLDVKGKDYSKTKDKKQKSKTSEQSKTDSMEWTESVTSDEKGNSSAEGGKVELGLKKAGKIQLQFKISQTSAEIISSGQQFDKDGNKKECLEEGEVSPEEGDSQSDDDKDDSSDSEEDGEVSGTGSVSDSEKEGGSKSKKKKKKTKKKKNKKKHKSSKEKENKKKDDKSSRKAKTKSKSRSPSHSRGRGSPDRGKRRSRSHSRDRAQRSSSYYIYDAYEYRDKRKGSSSFYDSYERHERDRSRHRDRGRRSRSRSRSRERRERGHRSRSRDRSRRSRSRSKSKERPFRVSDLRLKIDKAKLREIAIKNALALAKSGHVQNVDVASLKSGGKSINELTDFCKRISSREKVRGEESSSEDEREERKSDDEEFIHHPFKVKDISSIVMNIRDSKPIPIQTPQEKLQQQASLRLTFPVSSGSTHRLKESEWVPVEKTTATATKPTSVATTAASGTAATSTTASETTPTTAATSTTVTPAPGTVAKADVIVDVKPQPVKPEDKVFPDPPQQSLDISSIISERLSAFKQLQQNPHDLNAMKNIARASERASLWAQSKNLPGKFLGSTGANILSQEELMGPDKRRQAWAKKERHSYLRCEEDDSRWMRSLSGHCGIVFHWTLSWTKPDVDQTTLFHIAHNWSKKKKKASFHSKYSTSVVKKLILRSLNRRYYKPLKDQFVKAAPLQSGIGMALLQKMGWRQGEGLGKNREGGLEPLTLDFKTDRRGLTSQGENAKKVAIGKAAVVKDLSGKHPVSALVELCNRRKWGAPDFQLIHESGPDHKKNFLFKVIVNNVAYQPSIASNNKKTAKAAAATACLQELGLVPR